MTVTAVIQIPLTVSCVLDYPIPVDGEVVTGDISGEPVTGDISGEPVTGD